MGRPKGITVCHPERKHVSKGLCIECYRMSRKDVQRTHDQRRYWSDGGVFQKSRRREYYKLHGRPGRTTAVKEAERTASRLKNWAQTLVSSAESSSRARGHSPPTIDKVFIEDLFTKQEGKCFWTGLAMIPSLVNKDPYLPSLDRIDVTKGYHPENVVLSTWFANHARSTMSAETFHNILMNLRDSLVGRHGTYDGGESNHTVVVGVPRPV